VVVTSNRVKFPFGFGLYRWGFWRTLIVLTLIDYGGINIIRWLTEPRRDFFHPKYVSFWLGDSPIGLPLLGACEALMVARFAGSSRFYNKAWYNLVVLVVGFMISAGTLYGAFQSGRFASFSALPIGEIYHAVIFGVMFYLIVSPAITVLAVVRFDWAALGALIGAGCWIGSVLIDVLNGRFF
jgi:hypothetical protein